jgi:transcriptional regulator with XRE-family HTH domain
MVIGDRLKTVREAKNLSQAISKSGLDCSVVTFLGLRMVTPSSDV